MTRTFHSAYLKRYNSLTTNSKILDDHNECINLQMAKYLKKLFLSLTCYKHCWRGKNDFESLIFLMVFKTRDSEVKN